MILAVSVRAQHIDHVRMTCRAEDALVVPALARAKVVCRITKICHVRAGLLHENRAAGLGSVGDPKAAIRLAIGHAAVALTLVDPRMSVRLGGYGEFSSVGVGETEEGTAADLACVDVGPCSTVVIRTPEALVVGGRVEHARVCRIYREGRCAPGRSEARFERLPRLPAQHHRAVLEKVQGRAAVDGFPHAYTVTGWDLRDRARGG